MSDASKQLKASIFTYRPFSRQQLTVSSKERLNELILSALFNQSDVERAVSQRMYLLQRGQQQVM